MSDNRDNYRNFAPTNKFVYKGKRFPFNMNLFNCSSDYFLTNQNKIQQNGEINLIEESDGDIVLTDESIIDFVDFCQNKKISLKDQNIAFLHMLSKKFNVIDLIKEIEIHVLQNPQNFIIQFFEIAQTRQDLQNTGQYEDILSMNLPNYVQDNSLLSLPFELIYRVVTKYLLNHQNQNHSTIIDFLFKCLDKFGRRASILFEHVDFSEESPTYLHKIYNEYSETFDFNFFKLANRKTIYEIQNDVIQKEASIKSHEAEISFLIQEGNQKLKQEIIELKAKQEETNNNTNILLAQIQQLIQKVDQQNDLILELKAEITKLKRQRISCAFLNRSDPKGILALLGGSVTFSIGGYNNNNILDIRNTSYSSYFYNYSSNDYKKNKQEDSYIKFDFGLNKVVLHSYLIYSNTGAMNQYYHPKTWRIEGSNDDSNWILIDKRENDNNLNGPKKEILFRCEERKYEDSTEGFRFIRYFQSDSWYDQMAEAYHNPFNIYITFFELFGDVYHFTE